MSSYGIQRAVVILTVALALAVGPVAPCGASVVVLANRTANPVSIVALTADRAPQSLSIPPGECRTVFAETVVRIRSAAAGANTEVSLEPDCAYYVGEPAGDLPLGVAKIPLNEAAGRAWRPLSPGAIELRDAGVITVKILVDDDEVRPRTAWERILRERIAKASAVLAAHSGVSLRIVAVDQWDSEDGQPDFSRSMDEFEREVLPAPAQVAIGFSSQYAITTGRVHLGGTRGPLHSHIMLKERSRGVLETERLELIVHELGHVLGASHSPEPDSVMRPVITGGLQRAAGARVRFDPPNTLLTALVAQELRQRRVHSFSDVMPETHRRMREIYAAIEPTIPDDPAASQFMQLVASAQSRPLIDDARHVLQQIVRVAKVQKSLPPDELAVGAATIPAGDRLLELYVRQAALAAKQIRRENGPRALLLALGVALSDAALLQKTPIASALLPHLENAAQRTERLAVLGTPTMRGRADLAKHFFVSGHLVAIAGSDMARSAGLVKELLDSQGRSGFSFADMAANRAGIVFAGAVLTGRLTLDDVAHRFTVEQFLPPLEDLREQLGADEFQKDYGGPGDERLAAEFARIEARIMALPVYRVTADSGR